MRDLKTVFEKAKYQILSDIKEGIIPKTIKNLSELHDFVDANYYGGFCDENYVASENFDFENKIQSKLDDWIKSNEFNNNL